MGNPNTDLPTDQASGPNHGKMFELASQCRKVELKRILFVELRSAEVGTDRVEREAHRMRNEQVCNPDVKNN